MKTILVACAWVSLCFCAYVLATDDLEARPQFNELHYGQHQQSVQEGRRKMTESLGASYDGQQHQTAFGQLDAGGGVDTALGGFSGTGLLFSNHASLHGINNTAEAGAGAGAVAFVGGGTTSAAESYRSHNQFGSGSRSGLSLFVPSSSLASQTGSSTSYSGHSANMQRQQVVPEAYNFGEQSAYGGLQEENRLRSQQVHNHPFVYTAAAAPLPSRSSENYYQHQERRVSNQAASPIVYTEPMGQAEKVVHHEERRRIQSQSMLPSIRVSVAGAGALDSGAESYTGDHHQGGHVHSSQPTAFRYVTPFDATERSFQAYENNAQAQAVTGMDFNSHTLGSDDYLHNRKEHTPLYPSESVYSTPMSSGSDGFLKYKKIVAVSQPTSSVASSVPTYDSAHSSHGYLGGSTNMDAGHNLKSTSSNQIASSSTSTSSSSSSSSLGRNSAFTVPMASTAPTFGADLSKSAASRYEAMQQNLANGRQITDSSSLHGGVHGLTSQFRGNTFGDESRLWPQFGAHLGADTSYNAAAGSTSGLHLYMSEAERLAKLQAQGINTAGTLTGGLQTRNLMDVESDSIGAGGGGGGVGGGVGGGYKSKSWEKASKWSSQSQFGPDGQVKNYKELSTGESERHNINGKQAGYQAATATLDDNGKVSSYTLHT